MSDVVVAETLGLSDDFVDFTWKSKDGYLWAYRSEWGFWLTPGEWVAYPDPAGYGPVGYGPFVRQDRVKGHGDKPSEQPVSSQAVVDMVNHPPHYMRGPYVEFAECDTYGNPKPSGGWLKPMRQLRGRLAVQVECIDVIRHIADPRLATAMKYIWRVAFGGKDNNRQDIQKAQWYLTDWLDNPT